MAGSQNIWTILAMTIASIASVRIEGAPYEVNDDCKPSTSLQHITSSQDMLLRSLNANIPVYDKIDAVLSYLRLNERNNKDRLAMQLQADELKGAGLQSLSCPKAKYRQLALYYARISRVAYKSYSYVKNNIPASYINENNYEAVFEIRGTISKGFIAASDYVVIVAFASTETFKDELVDWSVRPDAFYGIQCHKGFLREFFDVYEDVAREVGDLMNSKRKSLRITGHGIGGAMAALMTYYFKNEGYNPVMYVYGCPPVCTTDLTEKIGRRSKVIIVDGDPGVSARRINPFGYKELTADYCISRREGNSRYGVTIGKYIEKLEKNCPPKVN